MKRSKRAVGFVFARGGSKGLPRKNIREFMGKPLLVHAIECAKASGCLSRVIVSTEDPQIAEIAEKAGAEVPFLRPKELASDTSAEWLSWQHALKTLWGNEVENAVDAFVSVPCTAPLRRPEDIANCVDTFFSSNADAVITVKPVQKNPFTVFDLDDQGFVKPFATPVNVFNRQEAPIRHEVTGLVFVVRPSLILQGKTIYEGKVKAVEIPSDRSIDIDNEIDFKLAEVVYLNSKGQPSSSIQAVSPQRPSQKAEDSR